MTEQSARRGPRAFRDRWARKGLRALKGQMERTVRLVRKGYRDRQEPTA